MNRITSKLQSKDKILSIYITAGYPKLADTVSVIQSLEKYGVDMIEIGLPYSDPLADGKTIQNSSTQALHNGMTTEVLFEQLQNIRKQVSIPLIIMGYFNPILQYGVEAFCQKCNEIGIDGLIIPDLPVELYEKQYKTLFKKYNLFNILLITPQTSEARIRAIDRISEGFIYAVSTASVTGKSLEFGENEMNYFQRIKNLKLRNPFLVGFGIHSAKTFEQATFYSKGAIIGSAFIKFITENNSARIKQFVASLKSN